MVVALAEISAFALALRFPDICREVHALGWNPTAARLAGISTTRYKIAVCAAAGLTAGVGAMLLASEVQNGVPSAGGTGSELEVITGVVLGGAALVGGRCAIVGTVVGVLLIGVLKDGRTNLHLQTFCQNVATVLPPAIVVKIRRFGGHRRVGTRTAKSP